MNSKSLVLSLMVSAALTGCSLTPFLPIAQDPAKDANVCNIEDADYQYCHYIATKNDSDYSEPGPDTFTSGASSANIQGLGAWQMAQQGKHFARINDYAEQLSMDLLETIQPGQVRGPIAVTSFVNFDQTLNRTDPLGNQLAESMLHELRQMGLSLVDFKSTDYVKVTPQGDMAFSREAYEITKRQHINYVLSGTMIKNSRGVVVQARIVQLGSNQVKASAKSFIPNILLM